MLEERCAGGGVVQPFVDVELKRDASVTVDVGELLDVFCNRDTVAGGVREAVRDEQWFAWGSASAHDALVEHADDDWELLDVPVARLEDLVGREATEAAAHWV